MLQFDLLEATNRREKGIKLVAENNAEFLKVARQVARNLAKRQGAVTADDVRRECPVEPLHPNAWGAVFKADGWVWTGKFRRSALVQGHGNLQRVWRYENGAH